MDDVRVPPHGPIPALIVLALSLLACNFDFEGWGLALFPPDQPEEESEEFETDQERRQQRAELVETCLASAEDYSWEFKDPHEETGSRGTKCEVGFLVRNESDHPIRIHVYREISSESSSFSGWNSYRLEPSGLYVDILSETRYVDGGETYKRTTEMYVVYDIPECELFDPIYHPDVEKDIQNHLTPISSPCR